MDSIIFNDWLDSNAEICQIGFINTNGGFCITEFCLWYFSNGNETKKYYKIYDNQEEFKFLFNLFNGKNDGKEIIINNRKIEVLAKQYGHFLKKK